MVCKAFVVVSVSNKWRNQETLVQRAPQHRQTTRIVAPPLYDNWLGDLWEEIIEFSTYGPAERRMLKARREAESMSVSSFQQAKKRLEEESAGDSKADCILDKDGDSLSLASFQAAVTAVQEKTTLNFDGYALRDLIATKFGVPVDIDFQHRYGQVYVTLLPVVGYGTRFSRHLTELDYLMHLQAVVEIMHKYDNLESWIEFLETTNRSPKPGTESLPFQLDLDERELKENLDTQL